MSRVTGVIYSLDLGIVSGFARGKPGDVPVSGVVRLKQKGESIDVAYANLIAFLAEEFGRERPALVIKEKMLALQAFMAMGNAETTVRAHAGYHAIVEGMCGRFGIDWDDVADSTARKHFLGRAHMGSREDTKAAVVERCHLLNLMPKDCNDNDRADAISLWDYSVAYFGHCPPAKLVMFGERI